MQSMILFCGLFVIGFIPFLGLFVNLLIAPVAFILWIFLMYQAFSGKTFKLPVIGNLAEKYI